MSSNIYIQKEAKNGFKNWTQAGLLFLLQHKKYHDISYNTLSKFSDTAKKSDCKSCSDYVRKKWS